MRIRIRKRSRARSYALLWPSSDISPAQRRRHRCLPVTSRLKKRSRKYNDLQRLSLSSERSRTKNERVKSANGDEHKKRLTRPSHARSHSLDSPAHICIACSSLRFSLFPSQTCIGMCMDLKLGLGLGTGTWSCAFSTTTRFVSYSSSRRDADTFSDRGRSTCVWIVD